MDKNFDFFSATLSDNFPPPPQLICVHEHRAKNEQNLPLLVIFIINIKPFILIKKWGEKKEQKMSKKRVKKEQNEQKTSKKRVKKEQKMSKNT